MYDFEYKDQFVKWLDEDENSNWKKLMSNFIL
jgi:hypothetical protein